MRKLIKRFFTHIRHALPTVFVTYNGDFFDWPFIETRAQIYGFNLYDEIGFYKDDQDEYKSKRAIHMDCYRWVKRNPISQQARTV